MSTSPHPASSPRFPGLGRAFRQAVDWVWISAAVGLLFNAFHVSGIELKVKPKTGPTVSAPRPAEAPAYAGWTKRSTGKVSPLASPVPPKAKSPEPYVSIGLVGAKKIFDEKSAQFLDARKPEDYAAGHIPGAVNFYAEEFDKLAPQMLPTLDVTKPYVIYCTGSECDLSHELGKKLAQQGFKNLKVFFGGWPEWSKAAYPVAKGDRP